jgi:hypothetical protein
VIRAVERFLDWVHTRYLEHKDGDAKPEPERRATASR